MIAKTILTVQLSIFQHFLVTEKQDNEPYKTAADYLMTKTATADFCQLSNHFVCFLFLTLEAAAASDYLMAKICVKSAAIYILSLDNSEVCS